MSKLLLGTGALLLGASGCTDSVDPLLHATKAEPVPGDRPVEIAPRLPHLETYPCAECHEDRDPEPLVRKMVEFHSGIELDHGKTLSFCDKCHVLEEPEVLVTLIGERLSFDQGHELCAQCHADRYKDFTKGIHGTQSGSNSERILRRTCTACHDPHAPGHIELEALPPPQPPRTETETPHD